MGRRMTIDNVKILLEPYYYSPRLIWKNIRIEDDTTFEELLDDEGNKVTLHLVSSF